MSYITLRQSASVAYVSGNTMTATFPSPTLAGSLIVVGIPSWSSSGPTVGFTIADDGGNNYLIPCCTPAGDNSNEVSFYQPSFADLFSALVWYSPNSLAISDGVVTATIPNALPSKASMYIHEYVGARHAPLDVFAYYRNTSGAISGQDMTPTFPHDMIYVLTQCPTPAPGFSQLSQTDISGDGNSVMVYEWQNLDYNAGTFSYVSYLPNFGQAVAFLAADATVFPSGVDFSTGQNTPGTLINLPATPNGVTAATAVNAPGVGIEVFPSGVSASFSVNAPGIIANSVTPAVQGVVITSGFNNAWAPDSQVAPLGVNMNAAQNNAVFLNPCRLTIVDPEGTSAMFAVGVAIPHGDANVSPLGENATFAAGSATAHGDANVSPLGQSATFATGTVTIRCDVTRIPAGQSATFAVGVPYAITPVGIVQFAGATATNTVSFPSTMAPNAIIVIAQARESGGSPVDLSLMTAVDGTGNTYTLLGWAGTINTFGANFATSSAILWSLSGAPTTHVTVHINQPGLTDSVFTGVEMVEVTQIQLADSFAGVGQQAPTCIVTINPAWDSDFCIYTGAGSPGNLNVAPGFTGLTGDTAYTLNLGNHGTYNIETSTSPQNACQGVVAAFKPIPVNRTVYPYAGPGGSGASALFASDNPTATGGANSFPSGVAANFAFTTHLGVGITVFPSGVAAEFVENNPDGEATVNFGGRFQFGHGGG